MSSFRPKNASVSIGLRCPSRARSSAVRMSLAIAAFRLSSRLASAAPENVAVKHMLAASRKNNGRSMSALLRGGGYLVRIAGDVFKRWRPLVVRLEQVVEQFEELVDPE